MSFMKSWQVISSTLNKSQQHAFTNSNHVRLSQPLRERLGPILHVLSPWTLTWSHGERATGSPRRRRRRRRTTTTFYEIDVKFPQFTRIWTLWYSVHWYIFFTSSVLCWFYLFFPGSSLNQSEDDESDDSDGSETNEDELTVKHKVWSKILDYLHTRPGVGLMGKMAGLRSSGLEIEPLLHP